MPQKMIMPKAPSKTAVIAHTTPDQRVQAWFALATAQACRLLHCSLTDQGKPHVEEDDAIKNTFPDSQHMGPITDNGAPRHEKDRERRFAVRVISWLQKRAEQLEFNRLVILARPHMFGALRAIPLGSLKWQVEALRSNLMPLNSNELAEHKIIRKLLLP